MQKLLSGNEAIAQGAWEAGVRVGVGYPGTPSTEITENLSTYDDVYCEWSPNEKVALEVALGSAKLSLRRRHESPTQRSVGCGKPPCLLP